MSNCIHPEQTLNVLNSIPSYIEVLIVTQGGCSKCTYSHLYTHLFKISSRSSHFLTFKKYTNIYYFKRKENIFLEVVYQNHHRISFFSVLLMKCSYRIEELFQNVLFIFVWVWLLIFLFISD